MEETVLVTLHSAQTVDRETATTRTKSIGKLRRTDEGFALTYQEGDTRTSLTVFDNGIVCVKRSGEYPSELYFEKGKRRTGRYGTPFGELSLGIRTKEALFTEEGDRSQLRLLYTIDEDFQIISENDLKITIKKRTEKR